MIVQNWGSGWILADSTPKCNIPEWRNVADERGLSPPGHSRAGGDRDAIGDGYAAQCNRQVSEPLALDDHARASSQRLAGSITQHSLGSVPKQRMPLRVPRCRTSSS